MPSRITVYDTRGTASHWDVADVGPRYVTLRRGVKVRTFEVGARVCCQEPLSMAAGKAYEAIRRRAARERTRGRGRLVA